LIVISLGFGILYKLKDHIRVFFWVGQRGEWVVFWVV